MKTELHSIVAALICDKLPRHWHLKSKDAQGVLRMDIYDKELHPTCGDDSFRYRCNHHRACATLEDTSLELYWRCLARSDSGHQRDKLVTLDLTHPSSIEQLEAWTVNLPAECDTWRC
jgi:hypothetical protein